MTVVLDFQILARNWNNSFPSMKDRVWLWWLRSLHLLSIFTLRCFSIEACLLENMVLRESEI